MLSFYNLGVGEWFVLIAHYVKPTSLKDHKVKKKILEIHRKRIEGQRLPGPVACVVITTVTV